MRRKQFRKLRFMLIKSGAERADFIRRNNLFREMGDDVLFQPRRLPNDPNLIIFHNNIVVAAGVTFVSHDVMHKVFNVKNGVALDVHEGCIEVLDNVFIGSNTTILPDVRIGPNVVIAAGSIISRDVAEGTVVGGVPAKPIGRFEDLEQRRVAEGDPWHGMSRQERDDLLWEDFYRRRADEAE